MAPLKFSFSTTDVPFEKGAVLWTNVLEQAKSTGHFIQKRDGVLSASIESYAFGVTTLSFWKIDDVGYERTQKDCERVPNKNYNLLYIQEGSAEVSQYGRTVYVRPEDCVLLNYMAPFAIRNPVSLRFKALQIPEGQMNNIMPSPQEIAGTILSNKSDWVRALATIMNTLTPERLKTYSSMQKHLFEYICCLLFLVADPTEQLMKMKNDSLIHCFRHSLDERFYDPALTPSKIAEEYDLSTRTLFSIFTKAKSSFGSELLSIRMENAYRLLSDPRFDTKTVAEIGRLVGFLHASHFTTRFNKTFGMTPSAFRSQRQKNDLKKSKKA
ncbi:MAG: AraC family transcriptional regulator [Bdellovibrionales bacterium]